MKGPAFALNDSRSGKIVSLHDFRDQPVLLTFWVSWCPDCHRDLPKKAKLYEAMTNEDLAFLTINVTGREHGPEDGIRFMEENELPFPVLRDNGREVYDAYKCEGVPTTIIMDKHHDIKFRFDDKAELVEIIQGLSMVIIEKGQFK